MILLASVCLLSILVLYRITRRPSRFPPGPLNLPLVGYLPFLGTEPHKTFVQLGKKYGDVFSVNWGPFRRLVVLNSYSAIKDGFKEDLFSGRPDTYLFIARSEGHHGVIFNEGSDWQEVRRFSLRALRDFGFGKSYLETAITNEIAELLHSFKKDLGVAVDPNGRFTMSVLNALWTMVTGDRIQADDVEMAAILNQLRRLVTEQEVSGPAQLVPYNKCIPRSLIGADYFMKQTHAVANLLQKQIIRQLEAYKKDGQTDNFIKTFAQKMSQAGENSAFYGDRGMKNLVYTVMDLFVAGAETVSTTLTFMIFYLAKNRHVQDRVHKELDAVVGRSRLPTLEDKPLLPYTEAVLMETHRCASLTPLGLPHGVIADTEFRGYTIPKGTILLANVHAVHNDPETWEKPNQFYPEHFLDSQGKVKHVEQLIPFLIGKRSCLGESLAKMELFLFATHLLHTFRFTLADTCIPTEGRVAIVRAPPSYEVVLSLR